MTDRKDRKTDTGKDRSDNTDFSEGELRRKGSIQNDEDKSHQPVLDTIPPVRPPKDED